MFFCRGQALFFPLQHIKAQRSLDSLIFCRGQALDAFGLELLLVAALQEEELKVFQCPHGLELLR